MFGQLGISALDSRPFTVSPILKPVTVIVDGKKIDSAQSAIFLDGSVRVPIRKWRKIWATPSHGTEI